MKNQKDYKQEILIALFLISRAIRHKIRRANQDKMLEAIVLLLIKSNHSLTLQKLSKKLSINLSSTSELVTKLENKKLITKEAGKDKRKKFIFLTKQGEKYLTTLHTHINEKTNYIFKDFSKRETRELHKFLYKILNLHNHEKK